MATRAVMSLPLDNDLFSLADIAAATGVSDAVVLDLAARGCVVTLAEVPGARMAALVTRDEAIAAVRALATGTSLGLGSRAVLAVAPNSPRAAGLPVLASIGLHTLAALTMAALASLGWSLRAAQPLDDTVSRQPSRLVYLAQPGPGGGGGGGGLEQELAPPKAERQGAHSLSSPLPPRELPPPVAPDTIEPLTPIEAKMLPPVMAPIAAAPADARTTAGVMTEAPPTPSQGAGDGGGNGTGRGTGLGLGNGAGIGDGSGGGMGGGPYRAGSGIEPPRLLREVKAAYTDEARRANVTGAVEMEITIRRDGTVSDVKVLRGLGGGLDERAVAAVRQWRFAPARLRGTPVDVIVAVSVEFTLR